MHVESSVQVVQMPTEYQNTTELSLIVDPTVTSECGIQAASDTVCRGAQVTPLTRDAGCQYEDTPIPMATTRTPLITPPYIFKPSPIKQKAASSSPPPASQTQGDQAAFLAALQQLHPSPTRSSSLLPSPDTLLQSHIKALQSQSLHDSVLNKEQQTADTSLLRGLGESNDQSLMSILQPGLMNSLPLTSYALLLDMINRQSFNSTNTSLLNHINQQLAKQAGRPLTTTPSSVLKPTPTLLSAGGLCTGGLNTSHTLTANGVLTPTSLSSPILSTSCTPTAPISGAGLLSGMSYMRTGSSPPVNIPTMLNRHSNGKRGFTDSTVKREVDIESLVDSVIDEHMSNKPDNNPAVTSLSEHLTGTQNCLYSRSELMNDYEMTPPFKRRRRTVFTEKQLQGLEEAYGKSQYLDRESRLELCKKLSLSLHTVVYWFQNKRAISRRRGQPLDISGANSNSSSIENIHAYTSDNVKGYKTSPPFKTSPPHSPLQFGHYTSATSPVKPGSRHMSPSAGSLLTSPGGLLASPPTSGLMSSPSSSVMSATLTSAISKNVLNMNQMVGATI